METALPIRILLVGAGNMGRSHGLAYHHLDGFELCGIVSRGESGITLAAEFGDLPHYTDYEEALEALRPDAVSIASYTESHYPYARAAFVAGCHVFVEKPMAETVAQAEELVELARANSKAFAVGYILRHHPSWKKFISVARGLGKPLVMRMNLNQQSSGSQWDTHKSLLKSTSPLVDCGIHYIDVMQQMTGSPAVQVHTIGARLSDDIDSGAYNYGQLQVTFADGSIGWYEAGWGPMMSETAFFVKDVIGPGGSASIESGHEESGISSSDTESHTATNTIRVHHAELDESGEFLHPDNLISTAGEPSHDELCHLEQVWFLDAIHGRVSCARHMEEAVDSLRIVLAADESFRTGKIVYL